MNTLVFCFINAVSLHSQLTGCNMSCITQEKPGLPADAWVSQAERLMQCRTCGAVLMKNLNKEPVVFRLTEKNRMTSVPLSLRRRAVCCKHTWTETYQLIHSERWCLDQHKYVLQIMQILNVQKKSQSGFKTNMEHYKPYCSEVSENLLWQDCGGWTEPVIWIRNSTHKPWHTKFHYGNLYWGIYTNVHHVFVLKYKWAILIKLYMGPYNWP